MGEINGIANPVYLFTPKTFIPMLDMNETREMIKRLGYFMGLDFDSSVIAHIHNRFGGHPFFTRQLCSQVHKRISLQRPQKVSLNTCKLAEQDVGADIAGYLNEILNSLQKFYPDEYAMLEYLATENTEDFGELARCSPADVEHLIGYGIVVRRGDYFEFSFDAVAGAVKENLSHANKGTSLEQKRQEISHRRNVIEEEIRSFLYRSAERLSDEAWQQRYSLCVMSNRKENLGSLKRREAFSKRNSPLYFTELLKFVQLCDEFDDDDPNSLKNILSAMNTVNQYRIDAHAKSISDSSYIELIKSIELLESTFLPP
jgi:hypothetical protein